MAHPLYPRMNQPAPPPVDRPTLLVVDDDPAVIDALGARLGREFRVVGVNDPHQAVDAARRERPDVILCDINMPGMQGDEVAFELSQDEHAATIPLIYLTSLVGKRETMQLDGQFGGHLAVSKSANTYELMAAIRGAMGS
jgi:CheY-like chemotaxis protein